MRTRTHALRLSATARTASVCTRRLAGSADSAVAAVRQLQGGATSDPLLSNSPVRIELPSLISESRSNLASVSITSPRFLNGSLEASRARLPCPSHSLQCSKALYTACLSSCPYKLV
eukprot:6172085-Pleurochrysis_carterae.AAC.1